MKQAELNLLLESLRRYTRFDLGKPLTECSTGLGYKSEYKPVLESGYMVWTYGPPSPRCLGWLKLTRKGAEIVQGWLDKGYSYEDVENSIRFHEISAETQRNIR